MQSYSVRLSIFDQEQGGGMIKESYELCSFFTSNLRSNVCIIWYGDGKRCTGTGPLTFVEWFLVKGVD